MRALLVLLTLLTLLPSLPVLARQETSPPDIIVVLLDDARAGDIERAMPQTQALLRDATWFPNFILTTPLCCPTRATVLTGQYAHNHGVKANRAPLGGWMVFRERGHEKRTVAVGLDAAGYYTGLFGKYFNGFTADNIVPPGWDAWTITSNYWPEGPDGRYGTDVIRDEAIAAIADANGAPVFLYVVPKAPHFPSEYAPRHADAFPERSELDRDRLRTILAVDDAFVAIYEALGPQRADASCVLILSDQGFLIDEHGITGKGQWWDQSLRVPMLTRCAGLDGGVDSRLAASIDIAPTILHAAGVAPGRKMDGEALQDNWDRERVLVERWVKSAFRGVKTKEHLYVEVAGERPKLYALADGETTNHLTPKQAKKWQKRLSALRACAGNACRAATR